MSKTRILRELREKYLEAEEKRLEYEESKLKAIKEIGVQRNEFNKIMSTSYEMGKKDGAKGLIKREKDFCFCLGEPVWRDICKECQDWRDEILSTILEAWILTNTKKKTTEDFFYLFGSNFEKDLKKIKYDIKNIKFAKVQEAEVKG